MQKLLGAAVSAAHLLFALQYILRNKLFVNLSNFNFKDMISFNISHGYFLSLSVCLSALPYSFRLC